jgi:hypothetical protein
MVAVLIALGFLVYSESVAVKILGALLAVLVGVVLKSLSEMRGELQRGSAEARQVAAAVKRSEQDRERSAREAEQRLDRVEASVSRASRQASRVQDDVGRQLAQFSEDTRRALAAMSERIERGGADLSRRVHEDAAPGPLRELGLSDSFQGIAPGPDSESS